MPEAVIVAGSRTPIGRAVKGRLADERAEDLIVASVRAAMAQAPGLSLSDIDDLLLGCGMPGAIQGNNLARPAAVMLGADDLPGTTVTRYCTSSVQTTRMAMHAIRAGEGDAFLSVGVESLSSQTRASSDVVPGLDTHHRFFAGPEDVTRERARGGARRWTDPRAQAGVPDVYIPMGQTAENLAQLYGISRETQDAFALRSQTLYRDAADRGFWSAEITPYTTRGGEVIDSDDSPRPNTTAETLAALKPVFQPDGTVTAGNACPLNDGAAALVVMSDRRAKELGLTPLARVVSSAVSALSPEIMGLGPVESSKRALRLAGMKMNDVDLIEINEAFAVQVLACIEEMAVDIGKVNVNGGAIALGHPFGMSGARLMLTIIGALRERDKATGLVTLCTAGGQGMAMILERTI